MNEALWDWYLICRTSNNPVSGTMLQEEALMIAEKMGISGFAASNGWLESFKKQHNLHHMTIAGEDGDVKDETIESWNDRVREITRKWKPENLWNMDETGSFWQGLPETSLNEKGRRCSGGKQAKQRNTWAFFVNAAEDPTVLGNYAKPRCFKNFKDIKRPYRCRDFSNAKAWMTTEVMNEVLTRLNATLIRKKRSILLFFDNAPCHPPALDERFRISVSNSCQKTQLQRHNKNLVLSNELIKVELPP